MSAFLQKQTDGRSHSLCFGPHSFRPGFTLLELLVVIAVIAILLALVAPAVTSLKKSDDLIAAAFAITGVLEQARHYAMANNTYTWVGFYEENSSAGSPTNEIPPYSGKGRLVMTTVYSCDGTSIFKDSDPPASLPTNRIKQIGKLIRTEGVHVTDIGPPLSPTPSPTPLPNSLNARPDWPYTYAAVFNEDHYNRLSSDSADKTKFSFTAQDYTFYKTVRFTPRGEANINSTYSLKRAAEIGLVPTHGTAAPSPPPSGSRYSGNVIAIQFSGVGGNFKVYRQ